MALCDLEFARLVDSKNKQHDTHFLFSDKLLEIKKNQQTHVKITKLLGNEENLMQFAIEISEVYLPWYRCLIR